MLNCPALYAHPLCFFFHAGLCSHAFLMCRRRGGIADVKCDRVDPSPRDLDQDMCVKKFISDAIDGQHMASRGGVNLHRMALIESQSTSSKRIPGFIGWSQFIKILAHQRGTRGHIWCIRRNDAQSPRDHGPIASRSWPDRGAIMAHLMRNQDHDFLVLMADNMQS